MDFVQLDQSHLASLSVLAKELNPKLDLTTIQSRFEVIINSPNSFVFGILKDDIIIGCSTAWETTRLYSGKQIELDNVVISSKYRSQGIGKALMNHIEQWAINNKFETIELNAYVKNHEAHKFYLNLGYKTIGLHFQKQL